MSTASGNARLLLAREAIDFLCRRTEDRKAAISRMSKLIDELADNGEVPWELVDFLKDRLTFALFEISHNGSNGRFSLHTKRAEAQIAALLTTILGGAFVAKIIEQSLFPRRKNAKGGRKC